MKCTQPCTFRVYTTLYISCIHKSFVYTQPCIRVYTKLVYTQNSTRPDQTRPDLCCQPVLTTTSHTTTGCGTYVREELPHGPNDPTHEPTAAGTTPPSHHPDPTGVYTQICVYTKPVYTQNSTRPDQTRPDLCCQSVLTTTSHTTTGCGTPGRSHPTVQTTRPMSPPHPEPPHRPTTPTPPGCICCDPSRE